MILDACGLTIRPIQEIPDDNDMQRNSMMINVDCTVYPKVTVYQIRFDRVEVTETIEVDASKDTTRTASPHLHGTRLVLGVVVTGWGIVEF